MLREIDTRDLVLALYAEAERDIDDLSDDERHDESEHRDHGNGQGLLAQQCESATVEQPLDAAGHHLGGEQSDQEGADDTADEVDADHVEGVVITGLELPAD